MCSNTVSQNYMASSFETHHRSWNVDLTRRGFSSFLPKSVTNRILKTIELTLNIELKAVLFEYNVQHDCFQAGCMAPGKQAVVQEHVESGVMETYIEHKPLDVFLINTHAFHNAHLIRAILPRDLTVLIPYALAADWRSHYDEIAQKLRLAQDSKWAAAAKKAAEKRKAEAQQSMMAMESAVMEITPPESMAAAVPGRRKQRRVQDVEIEVVGDNDQMDGEEDGPGVHDMPGEVEPRSRGHRPGNPVPGVG